ncbi:hypothetical protein ACIBF6_37655 [Streptosporangium amethystogenes]|uniref:hypothetical protein n=1 Tax=Streptosporangium amethystogenes TaxID=2002 RepID=UPI0037A7FB32
MPVTEILELVPSPEQGQRAGLHLWGFQQPGTFVTYKAVLAGVAVRLLDSRNTSRACPAGHIDTLNRPTRDDFRGVSRGLADPADYFEAIDIGRRAVRHTAGDAA